MQPPGVYSKRKNSLVLIAKPMQAGAGPVAAVQPVQRPLHHAGPLNGNMRQQQTAHGMYAWHRAGAGAPPGALQQPLPGATFARQAPANGPAPAYVHKYNGFQLVRNAAENSDAAPTKRLRRADAVAATTTQAAFQASSAPGQPLTTAARPNAQAPAQAAMPGRAFPVAQAPAAARAAGVRVPAGAPASTSAPSASQPVQAVQLQQALKIPIAVTASMTAGTSAPARARTSVAARAAAAASTSAPAHAAAAAAAAAGAVASTSAAARAAAAVSGVARAPVAQAPATWTAPPAPALSDRVPAWRQRYRLVLAPAGTPTITAPAAAAPAAAPPAAAPAAAPATAAPARAAAPPAARPLPRVWQLGVSHNPGGVQKPWVATHKLSLPIGARMVGAGKGRVACTQPGSSVAILYSRSPRGTKLKRAGVRPALKGIGLQWVNPAAPEALRARLQAKLALAAAKQAAAAAAKQRHAAAAQALAMKEAAEAAEAAAEEAAREAERRAKTTKLVRKNGQLYAVSRQGIKPVGAKVAVAGKGSGRVAKRPVSPGVKAGRLARTASAVLRLVSPAQPRNMSQRSATNALARSLANARARTVASSMAQKRGLCMEYCKTGRCELAKTGQCQHAHDPSKVAVCISWLHDECSDPACPLQHKILPELMPVCMHFLKGICNNTNCPYLHVNVRADARVCKAFASGHCSLGSRCPSKHYTPSMAYAERQAKEKASVQQQKQQVGGARSSVGASTSTVAGQVAPATEDSDLHRFDSLKPSFLRSLPPPAASD